MSTRDKTQKSWRATSVAQVQQVTPALFVNTSVTGRIPTAVTRANLAMRRATEVGLPQGLAHSVFNQEGYYPTLKSVVSGLGLSVAQENIWKGVLQQALAASSNSVTFRQMFYQKAREDNLGPDLCRALLMRTMHYAKQRSVAKAQGIYTADDLRKANDDQDEASDPSTDDDGVPDDDSGDDTAEDDAQEAADALESIFQNAGDEGVGVEDMADLVETYSPELLAGVLKAMLDDEVITFEDGRFYGDFGKSMRLTVSLT